MIKSIWINLIKVLAFLIEEVLHIPTILWVKIIFPLSRIINNNPLVVLQLFGIIFLFGFSWYEISIFCLFFILTSVLSVFCQGLLNNKSELFELMHYLHYSGFSIFDKIDNESLMSDLESDGVNLNRDKDFIFKSMLKKLDVYFIPDRIKSNNKIPDRPVSFASANGSSIFLHSDYKKMGGFEKFYLLHEIGHLSRIGLSKSLSGSYIHVYLAILYCLLIAFRIEINPYNAANLILIPILTFAYWFSKSKLSRDRDIVDELDADRFALLHSNIEWFKNYPSREIAKNLFKRKNVGDLDENRINAFCETLDNLREGKSVHDDLFRYFPKTKTSNKIIQTLTTIFISISYLSCLFWYKNISINYSYLGVLTIITLSLSFFALFYLETHNQLKKIITLHLNPNKSEKEIKGLKDDIRGINKMKRILGFWGQSKIVLILNELLFMIEEGLYSENGTCSESQSRLNDKLDISIIEEIVAKISLNANSKTYQDMKKLVSNYTNEQLIAFTDNSNKEDWLNKPAFFRALADEILFRIQTKTN